MRLKKKEMGREKAKQDSALWRLANPERVKSAQAAWRLSHPNYDKERSIAIPEQKKAWLKAWCLKNPDKVKVIKRRGGAKRRALGFTPLNEPFIGCEGHHIDREHVIYIPEGLHWSIKHNIWNGRGMEQINTTAVLWLEQEVQNGINNQPNKPRYVLELSPRVAAPLPR
jgi:hypothetical protein